MSNQTHMIKILVEIKNVRLLVRFPCKLTFHLKTDTGQAETRNSYELKKGQCIVGQSLEIQTDIRYDSLNSQYEDKKIRLIILMASTNGVIPAGNVFFNPCNKEPFEKVQYTLPLQKCPDRSAQITFVQSFQITRKSGNDNIYQSHFGQRGNKYSKIDLKYSSTSNLAVNRQRKSPRQVSNNSRNNGKLTQNRQLTPKNRIKTLQSHMQGYGPQHRIQTTNDYNNYNELSQSQVIQEEAQQYSRYPYRNNDPSEKANYLKQIAKLKAEIKSLQAEDRWDQLISVKDQNEFLIKQLDSLKDKIRLMERKQRQYNLQVKQLKDECDRTKNKYIQAQSLKNQYEIYVSDRDRTIKEHQSEIKKQEEKIQDLIMVQNNQQKRIEFKESSYQQQLKKMNERYTTSQTQRQKVTLDYNNLLAKMEESEKKHQNNMKQKQRNYTEQKNRLSKKIDQLTQASDKMKQDINEKDQLIAQNNTLIKNLNKRQTQREQKLASFESELELANIMLKKEQDQKKINQKEIQIYKQIEQERNTLKKKQNELSSEIAKANQKIDRLTNDITNHESKIKDLQNNLNERTNQKNTIASKYNTVKKELDSLKKQQERYIRQSETLSVQNFNAGQKINDLKSKLQTEKRDFEQMKGYYEQQLVYLAKAKEYGDNEIEELKESLDKSKYNYEELSNRLKSINQEVLRLNEELMHSQEKVKRAEDQKKEAISLVQSLRGEKNNLQKKERQTNEQLKQKNENSYELHKKVQSYEQQLFIAKQKIKQLQTFYQQKKLNDQKTLKEKQKALINKGEELTQCQLEIMTKSEEISSLTQQNIIKNNQIGYLKQSIQNAKGEINSKEIKIEELKQEIKISNFQLQSSNKELESLKKQNQEQRKNLSKLKKQWQDYRRDTSKALEQLLDQISKDEDGSSTTKHNLLIFPDMNISAMQVEALKKRNALIAKYNEKLLQMNELNVVLEGEIKKIKKNSAERQEELQKVIKAEKEKHKTAISQASLQIDELKRQVQQSQQRNVSLSTELEKSNNEIRKKKQIIEQLNEQIKGLNEERENLRSQIKNAEQNIMSLKSNQIKFKANNQSKISEVSEQKDIYIEKLKNQISDLERKYIAEQKIAKEKEEALKKQQININELVYERDRNEQKLIENHEKYVNCIQQKKELEKKVKTLQKQFKESSLTLQSTKEALSNEKIKFEQLQSKVNEAYQQISESQVENEKLRQQLESATINIVELQSTLKQQTQKQKSINDKNINEIKSLKQKIIFLNSEIQLKSFLVSQNQTQLNTQKDSLNELKEELNKKKGQIIKLNDKIQEYKNQQLYTSQNLDILKSEKQFLEDENDRLKQKNLALEEQINELNIEVDTLELKQKEINKLKEELEIAKSNNERAINEIRSSFTERKNNNLSASRLGGADDKRKLKQLEQLLESKHIDVSIERKKLINDFEREKRALILENNELREQVSNLQNQFDFQRAQLNKEIENLSEQYETLSNILAQKEELVKAQERLIEGLRNNEDNESIQQYVSRVKNIFEKLEYRADKQVDIRQLHHEDQLNQASLEQSP